MYFLLMTVLLSGTNPYSADLNQEYQKNVLSHSLSDTLEFPFNKIKPDTNLVKMPVYKPLLLDPEMPVLKPPRDIDFDMPIIGGEVDKPQMQLFKFPDSTKNPLKKRPSDIDRDE